MNRKKLLRTAVVILAAAAAVMFYCNYRVIAVAKGKVYTATAGIPYNKTGLLLGTTKFLANKKINPFYSNRITAAAELMRAGKIKYLVISGDNSRKDYNEPEMMRADLIANGIDSGLVYLDYAGFRTFDSMERLKKIFGQDSVTVISQRFHIERALYIGKRLGISAIGYTARDAGNRADFRVGIREKLARVKLFTDFLLGVQPKFLGPPVIIPG